MGKATFLVTFDTELLWDLRGQAWSEDDVRAVRYTREEGLPNLLRILDELGIPATFALVAHLLFQPGEVEVPRPLLESEALQSAAGRGWYASLAGDFEDQREGLYWPALAELLGGASQPHELASHTLTHPVFDEEALSPEAARFEVESSVQGLAQVFGKRPTAFVFPRNRAGYVAELRNAGIKVFRGLDQTWWHRIGGPAGKGAHLMDRLLAVRPPVYSGSLRTEEGLLNVPGSMLFLARAGIRRYIPLRCRYTQAAKGIAAAVERGGVFHLWLHPIDLGYDRGPLLTTLHQVLKLMASVVGDGRGRFATMTGVLDGQQCKP
jgi:peptidoglycan/xylan/chitin deacetylase (PgdA/CDA1 family)